MSASGLASMLLCVCLGTALSIAFLTSGTTHWASMALGFVLALYALIALLLPPFVVATGFEKMLSPIIGLITGVITGATGVFVIPAVPYISALGFSRDELVQALGLSFTVSTVALAIGLGAHQQFSSISMTTSLIAVIPAMIGMQIGKHTRARIEAKKFRSWFLVCLFLLGTNMILKSIFTIFQQS